MTGKTGPIHRQLAFLDPLLRRAPLIVESHHHPARQLRVGHDEAHTGKQLPRMKLDLRYYSTCLRPKCVNAANLLSWFLSSSRDYVATFFVALS